ncbi:GGDEF domain-containing protein [Rhodoferax koreense]|uniref:diguanylate cyclase n=2 Tax=Rhodoferax koreensis TaxID=1842727 RepID=A0A1P8K3A8_9BURK|nr:GGDEF domain-containing protein [Rhodoferax koreense]
MPYTAAPLPHNEAQRLAALKRFEVLDTESEQCYDDMTTIAAAICDVPTSVISLIDEHRQWFKSRHGLEATQTPRDQAFCAHAILRPDEVMVVPDSTRDKRFAGNPLVTGGPGIRFYAGAPLLTAEGAAIGTICVLDQKPRELTPMQRSGLAALSRRVVEQLELRQLVSRLELQSMSDGLTGIWNRRAFDRRLREEWSRHGRHHQPLGLLMFDVDKFKSFNDTFGHPQGDQALKQVASTAQASLRDTDFLARYGGEEFAVLLPNLGNDGAQKAAERLRAAVERADWPARAVTVSVGVAALVPEGDFSGNTLVARADQALYEAKHAGRNRTMRFVDWPVHA